MKAINHKELAAEWRRLNPRFPAKTDDMWGHLKSAGREALVGYWSPLRLAGWLISRLAYNAICVLRGKYHD